VSSSYQVRKPAPPHSPPRSIAGLRGGAGFVKFIKFIRFLMVGVKFPLIRGIKGDLTPNYPAILWGPSFPKGRIFLIKFVKLIDEIIVVVYVKTTK
jgi:hypothetical protein